MTDDASPTTESSASGVQTISPNQLQEWLDNGDATLIDVREPMEHERESIPGSILRPGGESPDGDLPETANSKIVVHCNSGTRSRQVAEKLNKRGVQPVFDLEGGIQAWKQAGLPTDFNEDAPIDIQRQVQITAGSLILLGVIGGFLVNPWFYLLSGFIGAGLLYAGLSGTCGMALFLSNMPWNRVRTN